GDLHMVAHDLERDLAAHSADVAAQSGSDEGHPLVVGTFGLLAVEDAHVGSLFRGRVQTETACRRGASGSGRAEGGRTIRRISRRWCSAIGIDSTNWVSPRIRRYEISQPMRAVSSATTASPNPTAPVN